MIQQQWKSTCDVYNTFHDNADPAVVSDLQTKQDAFVASMDNSNDQHIIDAKSGFTNYLNSFTSLVSLGAATSCPADITFTVLNAPMTIRLSSMCPLFNIIRLFLNLGVYLLCFTMLVRSIQTA